MSTRPMSVPLLNGPVVTGGRSGMGLGRPPASLDPLQSLPRRGGGRRVAVGDDPRNDRVWLVRRRSAPRRRSHLPSPTPPRHHAPRHRRHALRQRLPRGGVLRRPVGLPGQLRGGLPLGPRPRRGAGPRDQPVPGHGAQRGRQRPDPGRAGLPRPVTAVPQDGRRPRSLRGRRDAPRRRPGRLLQRRDPALESRRGPTTTARGATSHLRSPPSTPRPSRTTPPGGIRAISTGWPTTCRPTATAAAATAPI